MFTKAGVIAQTRRAQAGCPSDSDAAAFMTAIGSSDSTICSAIDTLTLAAKANGWWTTCYAIYPFVGGDGITNSYNLKNPAQYQLSFQGGWTHSSTGSLPNGTTGYADTGMNISTVFTLNDTHLSFYSRSNTAGSDNKDDYGAYIAGGGDFGMQLLLKSTGGNVISDMYNLGGGNNRVSVTNTSTTGHYIAAKIASTDHRIYKNGSEVGSKLLSAAGALVNINLFISARNNNGTPGSFSDRQCAFFTAGTGVSSGLAATMYADIQTFQTSLGRNV